MLERAFQAEGTAQINSPGQKVHPSVPKDGTDIKFRSGGKEKPWACSGPGFEVIPSQCCVRCGQVIRPWISKAFLALDLVQQVRL